MKITPELLEAAVGCTPALAKVYAPLLDGACSLNAIDSPVRLAAFLAQIGHESGSFAHTREIADGSAYEGRLDLGNVNPGDGPRYRGRGLIHITGRDNYRRSAQRMAYMGAPDFEQEPEALEMARWAAYSAADWWVANRCNALADSGDFAALTRRINGGLNGLEDRRKRWERAKAALATSPPPAPENAPSGPPAAPAPPLQTEWDLQQPTPKEATMPIPAIVGALLPTIIESIPKLGKVFGSGSQVAERNLRAAEIVVETVKTATGAANEQAAVEKLRTDPVALQAAQQAISDRWLEIAEAGGGGIEGARNADAAMSGGDIRKSPSFLVALMLLPLVYMLVASLIGLLGTATWSDDVRAGLAGSLISAIIGGLVGYYYGQTTSRNRTPGGGSP